MSTGYVVRESYLRLIADKPGGISLDELGGLIELANEVDALERSFATRLAAARGDAEALVLSSDALEQVEQSADADAEVHRLLLRRCRRAETAHQLLAELLVVAEDELEIDETLLSEIGREDPALPLHLEVVEKKREVVARLGRSSRGRS